MNLTISPLRTNTVTQNKYVNFKAGRFYPSIDNPLYSSLIEIGKNSSIGVIGYRYTSNVLDEYFTASLKSRGIKNVVDMLNKTKSHTADGIEYLRIDMDSVEGCGFMLKPPFGYHEHSL